MIGRNSLVQGRTYQSIINIYLYMCVETFSENRRFEFEERKEGYVGGLKEKKEGKDEVTTL